MIKPKIAATGLEGLVGSRIHELLKNDFDFLSLPQETMDITNKDQVNKTVSNLNFDFFLHLAAYTNVDGAEKDAKTAWKINVDGTKNVFEAVTQKKKQFVYISTDFVFDGENPPYQEDSIPNPLSIYGKTKFEGEKIIADKGMIVRISYPYRAAFAAKKDFVRSIIEILGRGEKISGVIDQKITLTFIDDIGLALKYLFSNYSNEIFHIVGGDSLSPYESFINICEIFNFDKNLIKKTTFDEFYLGRAKRPRQSIIISNKNNFYKMKTFREGLVEIKKQLSEI